MVKNAVGSLSPRGLLHVVGDDDDRVSFFSSAMSSSIWSVRDRVEGRAGLVHEDDLGLDGHRPRDAEPLLLAARERQAGLLELVLDLVPEGRAPEGPLDQLVDVALCTPLIRGPKATLS